MSIRRVVPNISCADVDASRRFYTEFLGFQVAMDMGWILTLASPSNPTAQISVLRESVSPPASPKVSLTIEVADVDAVHAQAEARGIHIVYPLTTEPWGVRRFHVTDPNGLVINIMSHCK